MSINLLRWFRIKLLHSQKYASTQGCGLPFVASVVWSWRVGSLFELKRVSIDEHRFVRKEVDERDGQGSSDTQFCLKP